MFQEQWPRLETNRDQGLSRLPQSAERYQLLTQLLAQRAARRTGPEMSVQGLPAFRGPWLSREAPQAARQRNSGPQKPDRPNPLWLPGPMPEPRQTGGTGLDLPGERALAMQAFRMYKTHLDLGWSPAAAAAWAATIVDESGGDPDITERRDEGARSNRPSGHGLFQLTHPARRRMFEEAMRVPVERSTETQQLKFRDIELDKVPQFRELRETLRGRGTAGDMADMITRVYENPRNAAAEAIDRRNIANQILALHRASRETRLRRR